MQSGSRAAQISLLAVILAVVFMPRRADTFSTPFARTSRRQSSSIALLYMSATPIFNQTATVSVDNDIQQEDTYQTNLQISKLASMAPHNVSAANAALQLLRELPYPDTVTYNGVLKAFAKSPSKDGAQKAQDLLEEMELVYKEQQADCWTDSSSNGGELLSNSAAPRNILVKPNVRSYSTVMDAWSRRSGKVPHAAQHAHDILQRLEQLFETTGDYHFQPNTISYNTVIAAFGKDGGQADQALILLKKMGPLADIISYNAALLALARSGLSDAGQRAETLLREMTTVNARTYTTVIDAWSRSECEEKAERAFALLQEMEDLFEKTRDITIRPNCISYSTVINAYALSKDPAKARKAWNILRRMRQLNDSGKNVHAKPSLITYNSVLNACATSMPLVHVQVKQMVYSLYKEIMENPELQADHFTYGTGTRWYLGCTIVWLASEVVSVCRSDISRLIPTLT